MQPLSILGYFLQPETQTADSNTPKYYLGKEMVKKPEVEQLAAVSSLKNDSEIKEIKNKYYPGYFAKLSTAAKGTQGDGDTCIPLDATGESIEEYRKDIRLTLNVSPFKTTGNGEFNRTDSSNSSEFDITGKYDLYAFEQNPCEMLVALPLSRLYKGNESTYQDGAS